MSLVDKVAEGVYRLGSHWVVGISATSTARSLSSIAASPAVRAASRRTLRAGPVARRRGGRVLTHYHSDHVGSAEPIRSESGATVFAPARDAAGVQSGKVPIPGGLASSLWRPTMMRYMAHAVRNGGAKVSPVGEVRTYGDGDVLEVPGGLRAIHTPGHTGGHYSLLADGAGVLFAGDALGTVNVRFEESEPQLLPFNEDAGRARDSLSRLEELSASVVVVGHGRPFEGTPAEAVERVRVSSTR